MRTRLILAAIAILAWGPAPRAAEAPAGGRRAVIRTGDVRPGMTGFGLTVFRGGKVERFPVEVIDVVPGMLPQSDVVLIRCLDERIEHAKIIAGMSGSPIYLFPEGADGKRDDEALLLGGRPSGSGRRPTRRADSRCRVCRRARSRCDATSGPGRTSTGLWCL